MRIKHAGQRICQEPFKDSAEHSLVPVPKFILAFIEVEDLFFIEGLAKPFCIQDRNPAGARNHSVPTHIISYMLHLQRETCTLACEKKQQLSVAEFHWSCFVFVLEALKAA